MRTSQPSSGQLAAANESPLQRGCDEILSVHLTAATSSTINAALLATGALPVPVRLVDSGTAGFGVSCCVWAAAEAVSNGAHWGRRCRWPYPRASDRNGDDRLSDSLASAIGESPNVLEVVRCRIGPSVGAYAGLGTVGRFMFPTE